MDIQFSDEDLQEVFPFHLIIDSESKIQSFGKSISKVVPQIVFGQQVLEFFEAEYCGKQLSVAEILNAKDVIVFKAKNNSIKFKYQLIHLPEEKLLLIGIPIINHQFSLEKHHLSINDFAKSDNVGEQLFLIQATRRSLNDAEEINKEWITKNNELAKNKERFEMVVNSVNDIIFQTDNDGYWTFLNKAWTDIMQFTLEESIGKLFFTYLHPEDVQRNYDLFLPLINREKSYCTHQIRYVAKDGKIKWMKVYAILSFDDVGNVTGTTGTLQDITQQKENSEKFELLANNVSDIVTINDLDTNYTYVSPSFTYVTGFKPEEVIGKPAMLLLDENEFSSIDSFREKLVESDKGNRFVEHHLKTKTGIWRLIETSSRVIYDYNGKPTSYISSSRLVEERKRAENAIINALKDEQEVSQLKSKFISLVSHEMKTPMTSIYTGVEIMELKAMKNKVDDTVFGNQFEIIKSEVSRLNDLIEKILFWGKLEGGKISNTKEEIDLVNYFKNLCEHYNRLQTDGRIISIQINGTPFVIMMDPMHLDRLAGNLITNAFKYSQGRPNPVLELDFRDASWNLTVKDFGLGIPEKEKNLLFQSFFRASNVEHIKGNGLGMVVVKYFAEINKGRIQVNSNEGKGTEISVTFLLD